MRKAIIVTDVFLGDSGKGSTTDFSTRRYNAHTVIRHNGGANAAHHVVLPDGTEHKFSQFGAGTFAGAKTFLSKHMLVEPAALIAEANHLIKCGIGNIWDKITIDKQCKLITPFHRYTNRFLETKRGENKHGSCGMGIGQVMDDYVNHGICLKIDDLVDANNFFSILNELMHLHFQKCDDTHFEIKDEIDIFIKSLKFLEEKGVFAPEEHIKYILEADGTIIFEGAQGILLDEWHGFHPNTSWAQCGAENATNLLMENNYVGKVIKLGVTRAYSTRHGVGVLPTFDLNLKFEEKHNNLHPWQGEFRFGHLDLVLLNYAIKANSGVHGLVVSHLDQIGDEIKVCIGYDNIYMPEPDFEKSDAKLKRQEILGETLKNVKPIYIKVKKTNLIEFLEEKLKTKVVLSSCGPTHLDKEIIGGGVLT